MRIIIKSIRKILFASFFIYGFNLLGQSFDLIIPLNIYTIGYTGLFGLSGFLSLLFLLIFEF